jgi:hypothetical protein
VVVFFMRVDGTFDLMLFASYCRIFTRVMADLLIMILVALGLHLSMGMECHIGRP